MVEIEVKNYQSIISIKKSLELFLMKKQDAADEEKKAFILAYAKQNCHVEIDSCANVIT